MSLYDKMFTKIALITSVTSNSEVMEAAKACEEIAIADKIALLKELKSDTVNTNANFRLKLATMIGELENQLKP